jgi:hypothetical protein
MGEERGKETTAYMHRERTALTSALDETSTAVTHRSVAWKSLKDILLPLVFDMALLKNSDAWWLMSAFFIDDSLRIFLNSLMSPPLLPRIACSFTSSFSILRGQARHTRGLSNTTGVGAPAPGSPFKENRVRRALQRLNKVGLR